jgi:hypothetical protein
MRKERINCREPSKLGALREFLGIGLWIQQGKLCFESAETASKAKVLWRWAAFIGSLYGLVVIENSRLIFCISGTRTTLILQWSHGISSNQLS